MRRYLLLLLLVSGCSTVSTPSATPLTPATFTLTWPPTTFATTPVGAKAATPFVVTLSNYGTAAVAVAGTSSSNTAEFPLTTTCSGSLPAKSVCQVTVSFIPSATGTRSATVTVNANGATHTIDVAGTGVAGVKPQLSINPTTGPPFTTFTMTVAGATVSSTVTLVTVFTAPGAPAVTTTTTGYATDATGASTIVTTSDKVGAYENWVVDDTTGTASNHVTHSVK